MDEPNCDRVRLQAALVSLLAAVAVAGCQSVPRPYAAPLPRRISPEWVLAAFPNCVDQCEFAERDSLWLRIRGRADLVAATVAVLERPEAEVSGLTKSNLTMRLGATGQRRAHEYLLGLLDTLPRDHRLRAPAVFGLQVALSGSDPTGQGRARILAIACQQSEDGGYSSERNAARHMVTEGASDPEAALGALCKRP